MVESGRKENVGVVQVKRREGAGVNKKTQHAAGRLFDSHFIEEKKKKKKRLQMSVVLHVKASQLITTKVHFQFPATRQTLSRREPAARAQPRVTAHSKVRSATSEPLAEGNA